MVAGAFVLACFGCDVPLVAQPAPSTVIRPIQAIEANVRRMRISVLPGVSGAPSAPRIGCAHAPASIRRAPRSSPAPSGRGLSPSGAGADHDSTKPVKLQAHADRISCAFHNLLDGLLLPHTEI